MEPLAVRRVSIPVNDTALAESNRAPRLVLVTGDPNLRAAASRCLQAAGYDVSAAAHSGHALLACLTGDPVDLLVSELSMDETSGPALAAAVRRRHPNLRTVYFANSGTPECHGLIVRPFTRDDLLREVALAGAGAATSPAA
jgi:CheY-like chemotaxis protein